MKNYEVNELKNLRALSNAMDKIRRIFNNLRFKYIQMYNILKKANIIENNEKKLELLSRIKNLPSLRSSKLKLLNELKRFSQMANRLEKQNDTKIIKKLTKPPFTKVLTSKIFDEDERNSKTRFGNAPSFKEIDKSQLSDKSDNKNTIKNKISQNSTELTQSTKNENVSIKLLKKPFKNDEQKPINKWKNEKNDKISGNSTVIVKNHGKQNFTDKTDERTLCKYERKNNERKPPAKQRLSLSSWQNWRGQFRNRVTGIAHARVFSKTNERFAAVYVYPLQWASLSTELPKETENTIRFSGWEATNGIRLRICCDNANKCPIRTNFDVNKRSRRWKEYGIVCPSGTSKLLFICENKGKNQGACGLDNIRLLNEACE
ncbi:unnamed protein product [Dracunculus medinensis]|uniref:Uncharacterized protein n=1 Tax=Dracunculus medinensis TaxID=318479 RepID=A0A158Q3U5_DRAME|nr:unnamed protein product [Dracunculus medinensis]